MGQLEILAYASLEELKDLLLWFHHQGPTPIVIGGWAVYFYNPYLGSVDIDLVGPSMGGLFDSTLEGFERGRGYQQVTTGPLTLGNSFRKPIYSDGRLAGYMEIDACTFENDPRTFHEEPGRELPYSLCAEPGMLTSLSLGPKMEAMVPNKSLLLLYKLKALRDRQFDLRRSEPILGAERAQWLRSKIVKDASDLISLLDPRPPSPAITQLIDAVLLKKTIDEWRLWFTLDSVRELLDMREALRQYRMIDRSRVEEWVQGLMKTVQG